MKRLFACSGFLLAAATLLAQTVPPPMHQGPPPGPPKSPPATETATIAGKTITITYSSPRVRGREGKIFTKDGLIGHDPQYPIWRAGANAATTLKTDADLTIGDLSVPAGTYTLFVDISDPASWVLIVNKRTGEWGLSHDSAQDLGRTKMATAKPPALVEDLKYTITDNGGGKATLTLAWENASASVPIAVH
ncbi:MAG: DUF2911 domain-containing protein [Terracidiphilus sp.]|jgi:hypothetical protein